MSARTPSGPAPGSPVASRLPAAVGLPTAPRAGGRPAGSRPTPVLALGSFEYRATTTGVLIAAPHGTFDRNTAGLAIEAARRLGAGYVVARGFNPGVRINVNRPTEGAGLACAREPETDRAREVYREYERLLALAGGPAPLRIYVEVHGNARAQTSDRIEVATKGVPPEEAARLKAAYPTLLGTVRAGCPAYPALRLLVEPVDRLYWTAGGGKRRGTLAGPSIPRALHFELPASAREDSLIAASAALLGGLVEHLTGR